MCGVGQPVYLENFLALSESTVYNDDLSAVRGVGLAGTMAASLTLAVREDTMTTYSISSEWCWAAGPSQGTRPGRTWERRRCSQL